MRGRFRLAWMLLWGALLVPATPASNAATGNPDPAPEARRAHARLDSRELELTYRPPGDESGEEVWFTLTVRDRITGETETAPLDIRVVRERPFGGKLPVAAVTARTGPRDDRYDFSLSLPDPGDYEVQVILWLDDRFVTVPFSIELGGSRNRTLVLGGVTLALAVLGLLLVAGHRRGQAVREH